jgi:hypothetical protein
MFMQHDLEKERHLKLILSSFEQHLGLKINFQKNKLFCFGEAKYDEALYADLLGCG